MNDMIPEEQDPQYEEVIALLRRVNLNPLFVDSKERTQVISQARARLFHTEPEGSTYEDIPSAKMRGLGSFPSKSKGRRDKQIGSGRLTHLLNVLAAVLVIAVLIGSALLIFGPWSPFRKDHTDTAPLQPDRSCITPFQQEQTGSVGIQPKLTILTTQASIGQTPELKLSNFMPNTHVRLTHDGGQPIQTTTGACVVTIGQDGTTIVEIFIDRSFLVGLHVIEAQDTTNHVTVRATLRVVGANPARSPQLALGVTSLDMGTDRQGTKSVRSFLLENVGGGTIAWSFGGGTIVWSVGEVFPPQVSARRLPSWFIVSPPSGVFSQSETITITVDRGTLSPDFYGTDLVFVHQGESPMNAQQERLSVRMTMIVLSHPAPIMVVSPLNLTFNAMQEQSSPPAQVVSITNTGEGKLNWNMEVEMDGQNVSWLRTTPTQGVVSPGQTEQVTIRMNTKGLTPGTHQGYIYFWEVDSHGNGVKGGFFIELGLIVI
jgi:hypothetical protein